MITPVPSGFIPSKTKYVADLIKKDGLDITTIKKPEEDLINLDLMAYTYRSYRGKYTVYVKDGVSPEAFEMLDLHEKGHIFYNHMTAVEVHKSHFTKVIESKWSKIRKYFEDTTLKSYKKDKLIDFLYHRFSNIAQDMEINSKLFDDWNAFSDTIYQNELLTYVREAESYFNKGLDKIDDKTYKRFTEKFDYVRNAIELKVEGTILGEPPKPDKLGNVTDKLVQYCHPDNEGWPRGLDWMVYMQFILNDPAEWCKKVAQGAGSGRPPKNPNGSGEDHGISSDDVAGDEEAEIEKSAQSDEIKDGEFQDDDFDFDKGKGKGHDGGVVGYVTECTKFEDFLKILRDKCLQKKARRLHTNVLYNTNRNKQSGVIIPKRHYTEKWVPGSITILLDVSGSVPTDLVTKIVKSIVNTSGIFDPHNSHLVQWDTDLCSDTLLSDNKIDVTRGGGTEMADGMKYCMKYQRKQLDKFFCISDCEDTLEDWIKASKKMPGYKCVIAYRKSRSQTKDEWLAEKLSDYRGSADNRAEFLKVFDLVLLSVNSKEW
jgi:hypothetical protein